MDERLWQVLVRHFSGVATPAEEEELRAWGEAGPANAAELRALRAVWDASGGLPARGRAGAAWSRVAGRTGIAAGDGAIPGVHPIHARRPAAKPFAWRAAVLRIAAVLVVGFAAALLTPFGRDHVLRHTVATGKGEQKTLRLADGTTVRLGVSSRLSWPRRFGGSARDVRLNGAAYFDVAHDARRPFTVYTPDAVTRVLGTRFTVRDYAGSEPARIAVTEGRVAVLPASAPTRDLAGAAILVRGQAAEVASGRAAVVRTADEQRDLAWTRGTITFTNAPVRDVAAEVSRWYDVDLQVPDPALAARHLTITFDHEPLETVLQEMAAALNARVERRGLTVVLTAAPPARTERPAAPTYTL
ncbi:MAG TPA: FecR domain-containing protein [Longimicrobium sp.]